MTNKPIATIGRIERINDVDEFVIERQGMTREEIEKLFPPHHASVRAGKTYNMSALIRAVFLEAMEEAQEKTQNGYWRERKNIRGFQWYERCLGTLCTVMGEPQNEANVNSMGTTINKQWNELLNAGQVCYKALNLYSEKEDLYHVAVEENSPYPGVVVIVEKARLYDALHDLANTFEIAFCCTGGQDSKCAAFDYVDQLEGQGVDLKQKFTVFSFFDLDPQGWAMPLGFIEHLRYKISGPIELVRVGVTKDQIGQSVLDRADEYSFSAPTEEGRKRKRTLYQKFVDETGGIYIGANGNRLPAKIELDVYTETQIRERLIRALAEHVDGFKYQLRDLMATIALYYDSAYKSAVNEFVEAVISDRESEYEEIEKQRDQLQLERAERTADESDQIKELYHQIKGLERAKIAKCQDIDKRLRELDERESATDASIADERQQLRNDIKDSRDSGDIPVADDLIEGLDDDGTEDDKLAGWREWTKEEVGFAILDTEDVYDRAMQRHELVYGFDPMSNHRIRDWIGQQVYDAIEDSYNKDNIWVVRG